MIEIWMKNHLVSDNTCHIVNQLGPKFVYKECQILIGQHVPLVTLQCSLQLVLSKTIKIGDTNYYI